MMYPSVSKHMPHDMMSSVSVPAIFLTYYNSCKKIPQRKFGDVQTWADGVCKYVCLAIKNFK